MIEAIRKEKRGKETKTKEKRLEIAKQQQKIHHSSKAILSNFCKLQND